MDFTLKMMDFRKELGALAKTAMGESRPITAHFANPPVHKVLKVRFSSHFPSFSPSFPLIFLHFRPDSEEKIADQGDATSLIQEGTRSVFMLKMKILQ